MSIQSEQIENWVRLRDQPNAVRGIAHFLEQRGGDSDERLLIACDWYRRLGRHHDSLRILRLKDGVHGWGSAEFRRRRLYWIARTLNLLGASEFAQGMVQHLRPASWDEYRLLGGISLTRLEYPDALKWYEQMLAADPAPGSHASEIARINYADALYGAGQEREALKIVRGISKAAEVPILKGIAYSAEGEYLARSRHYREAVQVLHMALSLMPPEDQSSDTGFLLKWLGFALLKSGAVDQGQPLCDRAFSILYKSNQRPEAWLDIILLKAQAGEAMPHELETLFRFPGLSQGFQKKILSSGFPRPEPARPKLPSRGTLLDFSSDESFGKGTYRLGLSTEQKLLGWTLRARPWGFPSIIAKSLLWPDEVFSYLQMEDRLNVALHRTRDRTQVPIAMKDDRIHAPARRAFKEPKVISEDLNGVPVRPSLLRKCAIFSRKELERYYGITKSSACRVLVEWQQREWIEKMQKGAKSTEYRSRCLSVPKK